VACVGVREMLTVIGWGKLQERDHWEDLGVGGEYLNGSLGVWKDVEIINLAEHRTCGGLL
jgi:hypothetical protein